MIYAVIFLILLINMRHTSKCQMIFLIVLSPIWLASMYGVPDFMCLVKPHKGLTLILKQNHLKV